MTNSFEIEQAIRLLESAGRDGALNKGDYFRIASLPGLAEHIRPSLEGVLSGTANFPHEDQEALPIQKTILLVEDDEGVDRSTKQMLEKVVHKVIVAADPIKALTLFEENMEEVDLILADMRMRYMTGPELVDTLRLKKRIEAIFMSNPSKKHIEPREKPKGELLTKPLSSLELSGKIRSIFKKENREEK